MVSFSFSLSLSLSLCHGTPLTLCIVLVWINYGFYFQKPQKDRNEINSAGQEDCPLIKPIKLTGEEAHWSTFRQLRNKCSCFLRKAKAKYQTHPNFGGQ